MDLDDRADELRDTEQTLKCKESVLKKKEQEIINREAELKKKEQEIINRESSFEKINQEFFDKVCELTKKEQDLNDKDSKLNDKEAELKKKEQDLIDREAELTKMMSELDKKTTEIDEKIQTFNCSANLKEREQDLINKEAELQKEKAECLKMKSKYKKKKAKLEKRERELNSKEQDKETNGGFITTSMKLKRYVNGTISAFRQMLDGASTDVITESNVTQSQHYCRTYRGVIENRRQDYMSEFLQEEFFINTSKRFRTIVFKRNSVLYGLSSNKFSYLAQHHTRINCVIQLLLEMFACVTNEIYLSMKSCTDPKRTDVISKIQSEDSSNVKCLVLDQQIGTNQESPENESIDDELTDDEPKEDELTNSQPLVDV